ncbi:MAG TPA: LysR family transcriptional regulator [Eoetvoesiella sp.]|uniref:LysR family transcriptional regulator n=1 Tax=Eoetvoesiella sp. TaxID=1966355 RepID=UPI002CB87B6A|nr:LysR family transcriptional regulator [Eoetvoesiella sp.]HWK60353.1 LysR family transcriptional regulator [Eoetvoesiella sp.]
MELRNLRAFVEVVRQGGFSRAAKVVFATQPTVSKAVRQLEEELGTPLLERIGHRHTLTSAGEAVYRHATRMLTARDELLSELQDIQGLRRGTLQLGLPTIGSNTLFAPLFAIYLHRYPAIDIRLAEHGSVQLEEILRAGNIELAATLLPVSHEFESQAVRKEPLVALMPANHRLARRASVKLDDLRTEPFVQLESSFALNRIILQACHRRGFEPAVAARSGQLDFLTALVAAGLGIAFLPRLIMDERRQAGLAHVLLDEPDLNWDLAMIWRRGAYLSLAARAWLEIVRDAHSKEQAPEPGTKPQQPSGAPRPPSRRRRP